MIGKLGVDFPVEVVQQCGYCPALCVDGVAFRREFCGVSGDASLHSQRVAAEGITLDELTDDGPGFISGHGLVL